MKAWDETEAARAPRPASSGWPSTRRRCDELEAEGIDLDPAAPGHAPPRGPRARQSDHTHPHAHSEPGRAASGRDRRGGAGGPGPRRRAVAGGLAGGRGGLARPRAARALPRARPRRPRLRRGDGPRRRRGAGGPGRPRRRRRRRSRRALRLYAGQAIVHTSGLLGAEVLAPALAAGTQAGAFHPLVAFADLDRALAALHGATIAIEGDDELAAHLAEMAEAIGGAPVRLAPGSKAAYHAAAVLSAGGVVALLDTIREVAAVARPRRGGRAARSTCRSWSRPSPTPGPWGSTPR